ncbi:major intrinsic protein domain-containing protein [Phthorimaea operculella]|nr:major intrinsic protein domain-containing protein [Phthorimaea operculella]
MPTTPNLQAIVNIVESKVTDGRDRKCKLIEWWATTWKLALSEVLSTMLLLLLGCMTNITADKSPPNPLVPAIGFGFVVMFNIQIFGHISGAHMNPAVSIAALLFGQLSIATTIVYILAQCAGAILGYGILVSLSPGDIAAEALCVNQVHAELGLWQALLVEVALTTALNFMNCSVWDPVNKHKADSIPIKFGMAIVGLSLAGGVLTGCSMNPARSLGPALFAGMWKNFWIYCVGPFIGAIVPTLIYKYMFLKEEDNSEIRGIENRENK